MITLDELNEWNEVVNSMGKQKPYEKLYARTEAAGLEDVTKWLLQEGYIGIMHDGNTFIHWTFNKISGKTIAGLRAELMK